MSYATSLVSRNGARYDVVPIAAALVQEDPEAELLRRLRARDEQAFEQLVRRYGGRMLTTARRFFSVESDAHDVVQEAFLSAFRGLANFSGGAKLSTWLHRIVVNAALMKLRGRRRKPEQAIDDLLPNFDECGGWEIEPARWNTRAETLLERDETRALVRRCIECLPEAYRTILLLRDIEDLDTAEVATMLGLTANAVKIRLHRARQALRTLLARELAD
jgi:RNA polymerase sigma-70 factor (ECF subfamily)